MNFEHTEDRRMLADSLNRYLADHYGFETRERIAKSAAGFSAEHWRALAEIGVIGALFDEAQGGYGGSGFDLAVVFESLGRALVVEPFLGSVMAGSALATDAAHAEAVAEIIGGTTIAAFAHAEPQARYAMADVRTRAQRRGDGWVLDGAKGVVAAGQCADVFVVSARTSGAAREEAGLSLFRVPASVPGLELRSVALVDGGRGAQLTLSGVRLPAAALIGAEGAAYETIERSIGRGVLALCAESVGAMDVAKDATLDYLRTRKQFGVPIGSFQALQHRMADLLLEVEQARSAVTNAAAALDADRLERERALSAAKFTIGRIGARVAEECIQMHGAIGMTWELPLAHYAKRLVMIDHQLGDEDFHLSRYIALGS